MDKEKNPIIQDDILRYKKNKFASSFALLALVFNVLYFVLMYAVHAPELYKVLIGGSVILNLLVLLAGFYCSEGIKNYDQRFSIALFVLGGIQIARIFIYPTIGAAQGWLKGNFFFGIEMGTAGNTLLCIIFLGVSAACFILSGVQGLFAARRLISFNKKIESGEISIENTLKELDERDANGAVESPVKEEAASDVSETSPVQDTEVEADDTKETAEQVVEEPVSSEEADNG